MILAIDVGNTQTVVGVLDGETVLQHWRLTTDTRLTGEEIGIKILFLLQHWHQSQPLDADQAHHKVHGIAVCSTVPGVLSQITVMCEMFFPGVAHVVVKTASEVGVTICTDNPSEVGTDRVINAKALHHRYGGPAICVDCGTATTFDVVASNGDYLGGAIAPGIQLSLEALAQRGAQLRAVDIVAPKHALGTNTTEALRSGLVLGSAALIDGLVQRLWKELPTRDSQATRALTPLVVATGGLAGVLQEHSQAITTYDPWLTLVGLSLVFHQHYPGL